MCDATVTSDEVETMAIKKFTIIGADVSETGADYILKVSNSEATPRRQ